METLIMRPFFQKLTNLDVFRNKAICHKQNGHSPHVVSGEWVGKRCFKLLYIELTSSILK
jgi:hypothetical protein